MKGLRDNKVAMGVVQTVLVMVISQAPFSLLYLVRENTNYLIMFGIGASVITLVVLIFSVTITRYIKMVAVVKYIALGLFLFSCVAFLTSCIEFIGLAFLNEGADKINLLVNALVQFYSSLVFGYFSYIIIFKRSSST